MPNAKKTTTNVYLALMLIAILKMLGLNELVAGIGISLCYFLLWRG